MQSPIFFIAALNGPTDGCYAQICRSVGKKECGERNGLFYALYAIYYIAFLDFCSSLVVCCEISENYCCGTVVKTPKSSELSEKLLLENGVFLYFFYFICCYHTSKFCFSWIPSSFLFHFGMKLFSLSWHLASLCLADLIPCLNYISSRPHIYLWNGSVILSGVPAWFLLLNNRLI